ncbi:MAG: post-PEP-CTERM-1 domain-containing protein [Candidatus Eiseniibacteriota bacterium]
MRSLDVLRFAGLLVLVLAAALAWTRFAGSTRNPTGHASSTTVMAPSTGVESRFETPPAVESAALVAAPASAPSPKAKAAPAPASTSRKADVAVRRADFAPAQGGMVVGIDPETGVLGPATAEQREVLFGSDKAAFDFNWSQEGLVEVRHPSGAKGIDLQGRFLDFSMAQIDADGKVHYDCTNDPAHWMKYHSGAPAPVPNAPAALEEK